MDLKLLTFAEAIRVWRDIHTLVLEAKFANAAANTNAPFELDYIDLERLTVKTLPMDADEDDEIQSLYGKIVCAARRSNLELNWGIHSAETSPSWTAELGLYFACGEETEPHIRVGCSIGEPCGIGDDIEKEWFGVIHRPEEHPVLQGFGRIFRPATLEKHPGLVDPLRPRRARRWMLRMIQLFAALPAVIAP